MPTVEWKNRHLDLEKVDIGKLFAKIMLKSNKKAGGGGGRGPVELTDPDEDEEIQMVPQTAAALVKFSFYQFGDIQVGDKEHLHEWYINGENIDFINGFDDLGPCFVVAEPWDYHARARDIQFRLMSSKSNRYIMVHVHFEDSREFMKARKSLFYSRRAEGDPHNLPKYSNVQIFGADWTYYSCDHRACSDHCRLYRRYARCDKRDGCVGLIRSTAARAQGYLTTIPACRMNRKDAERRLRERNKLN